MNLINIQIIFWFEKFITQVRAGLWGGDETGYFADGQAKDIVLSGKKLPGVKFPEYYNTFLCVIDYQGFVDHEAFEEQIRSYEIIDWYPVYPIVRNRILPPGFYPQNYMTKYDMETY